MNARATAILLLSHGGFALLGAWFAGGKKGDAMVATDVPRAVVASPSKSPRAESLSANPILRASGSDFSAAWDEMIVGPRSQSGEPHGLSINFFVDWCGVDPESAIQGLGRLHAPRFEHNYLGNAINYHGAEMAPAFVKHWRELQRMSGYKVEHALGRSLNALAKEDPEAAAGLMDELPPGMRPKLYDSLFEKLDAPSIERLVAPLSRREPLLEGEAERLWTRAAEALDRADAQRGVWDGLLKADDPAARRAFANAGMDKARRAENWSAFFETVVQLDPAGQAEVREELRKAQTNGAFESFNAAIREECQRLGLEEWLEPPEPE